ncbi:MAG: hypothetical protein U0441_34250 [Polyangiaceae bacterium]
MPRPVLPFRVRRRPPWWSRLFRRLFSVLRVVLVAGGALGPAPPPPPLPYRPTADMQASGDTGGEEDE